MVTVKVCDLKKMVQDLSDDGIEYVAIEEFPADEDSPAVLSFQAYDGFGGAIDYEEIDNVDISADYKSEAGLEP